MRSKTEKWVHVTTELLPPGTCKYLLGFALMVLWWQPWDSFISSQTKSPTEGQQAEDIK